MRIRVHNTAEGLKAGTDVRIREDRTQRNPGSGSRGKETVMATGTGT